MTWNLTIEELANKLFATFSKKEDIKTLLPKIKQELEADGFPTRMSVGENYGALIKK